VKVEKLKGDSLRRPCRGANFWNVR